MGDRDHYLHGAEDVRSAGNTIGNAADSMRSAGGTMSDAASRFATAQQEHQIFLEDWLKRFEGVLYQDREERRTARNGR